jgi:hypothetical protein
VLAAVAAATVRDAQLATIGECVAHGWQVRIGLCCSCRVVRLGCGIVGQLGSHGPNPLSRLLDRRPFLGRPFGADHRQPQVERMQLGDGETHGTQEVPRPNGHLLRFDEHLQPLDEATRRVVPLADRHQIIRHRFRRDTEHLGDGRDRVFFAVGDARHDREQALELSRGIGRRLLLLGCHAPPS